MRRVELEESEDRVLIYTDGSCLGNPGAGGWGVRVMWRESVREKSGSSGETTNQRMELQAALEGLKLLKKKSRVLMVTDSEYVRRGMEEWILKWEKNGWRTSKRKRVKHRDLWEELLEVSRWHDVEWRWVKGHSEDEHNDAVDELAREAAMRVVLR